jgi:hypothetical protein
MRRQRLVPIVFALVQLAIALCPDPVRAQAGFEDDRVMLQGFYWESYRHGHPETFPRYGTKHWYRIVAEQAPAIRAGRFATVPGRLETASSVFDFMTMFHLKDHKSNYAAQYESGRGIVGDSTDGYAWKNRAVTFLENHDTGFRTNEDGTPQQGHASDNFANGWEVEQGYAHILTHPGLPTVYWKHYFDWGHDLADKIRALINARKVAGVHAGSVVHLQDNARAAGVYAARIVGRPGRRSLRSHRRRRRGVAAVPFRLSELPRIRARSRLDRMGGLTWQSGVSRGASQAGVAGSGVSGSADDRRARPGAELILRRAPSRCACPRPSAAGVLAQCGSNGTCRSADLYCGG